MRHYNLLPALVLTGLCMLLMLPFLGLTDFNTKGEPREALVVMAMADSGNWMFPFSEGSDMAYKPPFFHWSVLVLSHVFGGLNEFTSRLPSALAFGVMLFATVAQIRERRLGLLTGLLLMGMFEVHRAAMACRVDMMLAACMTVALFSLYRWTERGLRGLPLVAILSMSIAVLTKGPVGIVLPCGVGFVFALTQHRQHVWRTLLRYFMAAVLALIIPLAWYWKAYTIAGDAFIDLVIEENFGRFLGRMTYESHSNPFFMPLVFLLAGSLPASLLLVLRSGELPHLFRRLKGQQARAVARHIAHRFSSADSLTQFCTLTLILITLFYCIPSSKRSVYLLPVYPSIAYLLALAVRRFPPQTLRLYVRIVATLCCVVSLAMLMVLWGPDLSDVLSRCGAVGAAGVFYHGLRHAQIGAVGYLILSLPILMVLLVTCSSRIKTLAGHYRPCVTAVWSIMLFFVTDATVLPSVLGAKSDRGEAQAIERIVPKPAVIHSYCSAPMMRFFALNYYLGNRVHPFALCPRERELKTQVCRIAPPPCEGYILLTDRDRPEFLQFFGRDYTLTEVYRSTKPGCDVRDYFCLFRYKREMNE